MWCTQEDDQGEKEDVLLSLRRRRTPSERTHHKKDVHNDIYHKLIAHILCTVLDFDSLLLRQMEVLGDQDDVAEVVVSWHMMCQR